jgi:AraC family transcriptional regulator
MRLPSSKRRFDAMLTNSESLANGSLALFERDHDRKAPPLAPLDPAIGLGAPAQSIDMLSATVNVTPARAVSRRGMEWRGMGAEFVQATSHDRVEYSFRSPVHLLAAYEHGVRREGESYVEGLSRSTLRDVANKLTFAPAGHEYREWHDPRTLTGVTYFYLDPAELQTECDEDASEFAPRLFFEDPTIWSTAAKLKQAIQSPCTENRLYVEALGVVLIHELMRLNRGAPREQVQIRGGLAAWQERVVTTYIDEHLAEQIPLAALAQLVRLSTYYFCRAFKQSFGVPPHRYHIQRRIEQAKILLAGRRHSVTEVGLALGFSETSSFTATFRKITGQTPSGYCRSLG